MGEETHQCPYILTNQPKKDHPSRNILKKLVGYANEESGLVLNDVVIDRGLSSHMAKLDLYVNESLVTTVTGDGLILATSTGSTAYSAGMLF